MPPLSLQRVATSICCINGLCPKAMLGMSQIIRFIPAWRSAVGDTLVCSVSCSCHARPSPELIYQNPEDTAVVVAALSAGESTPLLTCGVGCQADLAAPTQSTSRPWKNGTASHAVLNYPTLPLPVSWATGETRQLILRGATRPRAQHRDRAQGGTRSCRGRGGRQSRVRPLSRDRLVLRQWGSCMGCKGYLGLLYILLLELSDALYLSNVTSCAALISRSRLTGSEVGK